MESVIVIVVLSAIAILADRFGDHRHPVHNSLAYRQALTGVIREPRGQAHVVAPPPRRLARTREDAAREPGLTPPDLTVQPT